MRPARFPVVALAGALFALAACGVAREPPVVLPAESPVAADAASEYSGVPESESDEGVGRVRKRWRRQKESYKKGHRDQIKLIARGDVAPAIAWFEKYLADHPRDLEALFGLAVAHTRNGNLDTAMGFVEQAVDAGLPIERFIAGPRALLAPLVESDLFREYFASRKVELIHGPMLGSLTDGRARFWVRTASETDVLVSLSQSPTMEPSVESPVVRTSAERDFTAVAEVTGLAPDTRYFYRVHVGESWVPADPPPSFRTFPPPGSHGRVRVGFGACAGYTPQNERMWDTLAGQDLQAFLMLGDNVYIDAPASAETQRYCYYRRYSRPEWRRFVGSTPVFAVWDDHDFGTNEAIGGPDVDVPAWKIDVWRVFVENFNNPYYAGGAERPGVWHDFAIGDVDFFLLDGRYYRDDPRTPRPSMLGPVQKAWLFEKLAASTATFKVIASPVPWAFGVKRGPPAGRPRASDAWEGYPDEREQVFRFIEDHQIDGVVLLSGDRHRSDAWKIPREGGGVFFEWLSARLTNSEYHRPVENENCIFSYEKKPSFGRLTFVTDIPEPTVTYEVLNIDGEILFEQTVALQEAEP